MTFDFSNSASKKKYAIDYLSQFERGYGLEFFVYENKLDYKIQMGPHDIESQKVLNEMFSTTLKDFNPKETIILIYSFFSLSSDRYFHFEELENAGKYIVYLNDCLDKRKEV